jgi:hypothetical protein
VHVDSIEAELSNFAGAPALRQEAVNRTKDRLEFLLPARGQVCPQHTGIIVSEKQLSASLIPHAKKTPKMAAKMMQDRVGVQEDAPRVPPSVPQNEFRETVVRFQLYQAGSGHL